MKIRVDDIKDKVIHLESEVSATEFPQLLKLGEAGECDLTSPVHYALSVLREYDHIRVEGTVSSAVRLSCSRCLKEYESPLDSTFTLIYSKATGFTFEEEVELDDNDLISMSYEGSEIDFAPVIEEQLLMELPIKPVCQEDCLGLCTSCGEDLNKSPCTCNQREVNIRMSVLEKLKIQ